MTELRLSEHGTVKLVPAKMDHAGTLLMAMQPDESRHLSFFTEPITFDREWEYLKSMQISGNDTLFLVISIADGAVIGTAGLHEIDWHNHTARLGMLIFDPNRRGKGCGREVMAILLRYGFTELKLNKVYLKVFASNSRAQQIYLRAGFIVEGYLRQEYLLEKEYRDMLRLSLLKQEWEIQQTLADRSD